MLKRLFLHLAAALAMASFVLPSLAGQLQLLSAATTAAAGTPMVNQNGQKTYQASGTTSAGAGSATIVVQGSNDNGASWDTIGTITLTLGTTRTSDSFTSADRYAAVRGNVTAISGTDASVNLIMGY